MGKTKNLFSFVDDLLEKFRKIIINTLTFLFLILITFGFFFSLGSLFESDNPPSYSGCPISFVTEPAVWVAEIVALEVKAPDVLYPLTLIGAPCVSYPAGL